MRKLILILVVFTTTIFANEITVEVSKLVNKNGKLSIGLYNKNDDTFANMTEYYKGVNVTINDKKVIYTFKDIPNGTYAIAVIHDENENRELDKNFLGIPKEGYGFSNNIRHTFRGANFKESKFVVNSNRNIVINIGY